MTQTTKMNHSNYQDKTNEYDTTYQKVKAYLKEVGVLSEENLIYPEQIVDNIYCAIESDKKHLTGLGKRLAGITNFPKEEDKQSILRYLLKKKVKNFICQTVFKKESFLDFVEEYIKLKDDKQKTVVKIWQDISNKVACLKSEALKKVKEDIIFSCMPIFLFYETHPTSDGLNNEVIGSIHSVYIHAALHFLNDNDIPFNQYNDEEIIQVGTFLEYTIKKGSLPENVRYFLIPAALSYAIKNTKFSVEEILNSLELRQKAVTAFFNSVEAENEEIKEKLPINSFIKAMEGYKTRTELAKEQLACIGITDNETLLAAYKTAPTSLTSSIDSRLPNLTALFQNQNENIAEKFRKVESIFIQEAIESLSIRARDFFNFGQVSYIQFFFKERLSYLWTEIEPQIFPGPPQHPDILLLTLPEYIYSLICVEYLGEKKYFILFAEEIIKYKFYEIDATKIKSKDSYLPLLEKDTAISNEVIEKIKNSSCIVELEQPKILKTENEPATKLVEELTRIRKDSFRDHLHRAGNESTVIEKIADFVKHLIPFYDAINSLREGKRIEAAGYFALDLLMLLPLIGEAAKISTSMSKVLLSTANLSKTMMTRYLTTGSLIFAIQKTTPFFFRQGILGASNVLTKQTLIDVMKATLRSVDPGFELISYLGKYCLKNKQIFKDKTIRELNAHQDYLPVFKKAANNIKAKNNVVIPLQKKFITNERLSSAIKLAQQNKYEEIINELTSLQYIAPKVTGVQPYILAIEGTAEKELNLSNQDIRTITDDMMQGVSRLNISNTSVTELHPHLLKNITHLNISHTQITSLPKLNEGLIYLNISHTKINTLPARLPLDLKELDISNTCISELPVSCPGELRALNISYTQIDKIPISYYSILESLDYVGSKMPVKVWVSEAKEEAMIVEHYPEERELEANPGEQQSGGQRQPEAENPPSTSRQETDDTGIVEQIKRNASQFKINKFLPKQNMVRSDESTSRIKYVISQMYGFPFNNNDFHIHSYGTPKADIPADFFNLHYYFDDLYREVDNAESHVIKAKEKILNSYELRTDNNNRKVLVPKTTDLARLVNSPVRVYFSEMLRTKDILIIHEVINRFYFYVIGIEKYFNTHKSNINFVSCKHYNHHTDNTVNRGPAKKARGFTLLKDIKQNVFLMVDSIYADDVKFNRPAHVLLHEISHSVGASYDLLANPILYGIIGDAYDINEHVDEVINGLVTDNTFMQPGNNQMINEYAKVHQLPSNSITPETFLKIAKDDKMLKANIIMENAHFLPIFISDIAQGRKFDAITF